MAEEINRLKSTLPSDDILSQCIHCGLCLAACPTYDLTQLERSSPRGRIKMIKSVAAGEMEVTKLFADEMYFCLDCQACESACPAGVKYGVMVEAARAEADRSALLFSPGKILRRFVLKNILAKPVILKFVSRLLRVYQKSYIRKFLHSSGILNFISTRAAELDKLAPSVSGEFSSSIIPEISEPTGEIKFRTAFHTGCLMDVMFAGINNDTVDVLLYSGAGVYTPKGQVCCGSLHAHNGDFETAKKLARKNINIFSGRGYDYLVSNSAGCGAFMKEYGSLLKDDKEYCERAVIFSSRVKDITEFIYENDIRVEGDAEEEITYHEACHLVHSQKVSVQPLSVLEKIAGEKLISLNESTKCCGSAGIYNITHYDDSMKILMRKMDNIKNTKAGIVITGNPGCMQQIKYGAEKFNADIKVMHPVTWIKNQIIKNKPGILP